MCGRYYVDEGTAADIARLVGKLEKKLQIEAALESETPPVREPIQNRTVGDIYPSQQAPVICWESGRIRVESMRWGFKSYQGKGLLINARAESILEKKTFRESALHRRCILLARHFYEWNGDKEKAVCYRAGEPALYMAGCYHRTAEENRFVVITTQANERLSAVHPRMPLLLEESELDGWLFDGTAARDMLRKSPAPAEYRMEFEQLRLF